ncbi:MAG: DUF6259 domain-containing protein [Candidatus Hydrogenedentota bacterium]
MRPYFSHQPLPLSFVLVFICGGAAFAFHPPEDTAGPLRVWIEGPDRVTLPQTPIPMTLWIENTGDEAISGTLRLEGIDDWHINPAVPVPFTVDARQTILAPFSATAGEGTFNALYPFHGYAEFEYKGASYEAHPILILRTDFPESAVPYAEARREPVFEWPPRPQARVTRPGVVFEGVVGKGSNIFPFTVTQGKRGLMDGTLAFGADDARFSFTGFEVKVLGIDLHDPEGPARLRSVETQKEREQVTLRHAFALGDDTFDVVFVCEHAGEAMRIHVALENAPPSAPWLVPRLEKVALGPWNKPVFRVYAGHGNVIERPRVFTPGYEGHRLSTSYVGADFEGGGSLVYGTPAIPDLLRVRPARNEFTLDVPHDHTLVFIPTHDVWDGVKVWRDIDNRPPAAGVENLAGRFVFDLWFGRSFAEGAEGLARAFRYGLTDAAVVWHDWQRWGYDYRLPDILPPNPRRGGTTDFKRLIETCRAHGVLFAPHDNYIDFYPDATGFTYDRVAFKADGTVDEAWFNPGPQAQSCKFRADAFWPFMEKNVARIQHEFAPTAYFIDVWSSRPPYDFWTRNGAFFDRFYTKQQWQKTFAHVRETLGNNAPTISESGNDQLIGFLDGAQTNHLRVDARPESNARYFVWRVHCNDAQRIPWFDAAHHHRFILHGAGYGSRYAAGLDRRLHGMYSDDYITTEVLTGHPAMVSDTFGRDVVRKYWLLHDLARALALQQIDRVSFIEDNIHRQHITWSHGGEVSVNRGPSDWDIHGHILPQYGFYARMPGGVEAAIERKNGTIVEWALSPEAFYCNGRAVNRESFPADAAQYAARVNPPATPINFGPVTTSGGLRLTRDGDALIVTPLPGGWAPFNLTIRWHELPWKLPVPKRVTTHDETRTKTATHDIKLHSGLLTLPCEPAVFTYRLSAQ